MNGCSSTLPCVAPAFLLLSALRIAVSNAVRMGRSLRKTVDRLLHSRGCLPMLAGLETTLGSDDRSRASIGSFDVAIAFGWSVAHRDWFFFRSACFRRVGQTQSRTSSFWPFVLENRRADRLFWTGAAFAVLELRSATTCLR